MRRVAQVSQGNRYPLIFALRNHETVESSHREALLLRFLGTCFYKTKEKSVANEKMKQKIKFLYRFALFITLCSVVVSVLLAAGYLLSN